MLLCMYQLGVSVHTAHMHTVTFNDVINFYMCLKLMWNDAMIAREVDAHPVDCYEKGLYYGNGNHRDIAQSRFVSDLFPRLTLGFLSGNEPAI